MRKGIDCKGVKYQEVSIGRSKDLSNNVYGKLTCLYRVIKTDKCTSYRDTFWLCKCDCGNEVVASAHSLNKKETLSCGCYHKKRVSETSKKNEIGNIYGYLKVIEEAPSINGRTYWLCECKCGKKVVVPARNLRSGNTKSCGCLHKEHVYEKCLIDETGNKYGQLTVIKQVESKIYKDGHSYSQWLCKCDCGREVIVKGINLRSGNVHSCGCIVSKGETKLKNIFRENNINYVSQYTLDDCVSSKNRLLKFDFAILDQDESLICLIEYQGVQHYKDTFWESPIENDAIKREYCKKHNIKLIEIPYLDYEKINIEYIQHLIFD